MKKSPLNDLKKGLLETGSPIIAAGLLFLSPEAKKRLGKPYPNIPPPPPNKDR